MDTAINVGLGVFAIALSVWFYRESRTQAERAETALRGISDAVLELRARQGTLNVSDFKVLLDGFSKRALEIDSMGDEPKAEAEMQDLFVEALMRAGIRSNSEISSRLEEDSDWFRRAEEAYQRNSVGFTVLRRVRVLASGGDEVKFSHVRALLGDHISEEELRTAVMELARLGDLRCSCSPPNDAAVLTLPPPSQGLR